MQLFAARAESSAAASPVPSPSGSSSSSICGLGFGSCNSGPSATLYLYLSIGTLMLVAALTMGVIWRAQQIRRMRIARAVAMKRPSKRGPKPKMVDVYIEPPSMDSAGLVDGSSWAKIQPVSLDRKRIPGTASGSATIGTLIAMPSALLVPHSAKHAEEEPLPYLEVGIVRCQYHDGELEGENIGEKYFRPPDDVAVV
ncbi:hypothetical protein HMN09_01419600 [Mycena chlorophos]|uniref:Uncharacterized protein n=1 Tax=Mycena chlorophos TaxID=658473 RepID=A0A8H6RWI2_MYCCL|nr:hypothetical protein HMN09_01419600 [Mycena chlorophos]